MAANALSRLPTGQVDDLDFDDDLPAYAVAKSDRDEQKPPTIQAFVASQRPNAHSWYLSKKAGFADSSFLFDGFGILSGRARFDGAIPKFVPVSLRAEVPKQEQHSTISGHPGTRRMYDAMRQSY